MPKKHLREKRLDALELLSYGQSVRTVHYATGIPLRTIYNWKAKLKHKHYSQMAQKDSQFATKPPQEPDSCHIAAASRQLAPDSCQIDSTIDADLPQNCHSDEPSGIIAPPEQDTAEEHDQADTDYEDFTYIREQLMKYARKMAADLRPDDPDSNRRTLALSRILDRIQWLDEILPDRIPERTLRFEYYYDGQVQEHPPWHPASDSNSRRTVEDYMSPPDSREAT